MGLNAATASPITHSPSGMVMSSYFRRRLAVRRSASEKLSCQMSLSCMMRPGDRLLHLVGDASLHLHSINSRFMVACMSSRHAAGDPSILSVKTPTSTCNPMTDAKCWRATQTMLM